MSRSDRGTRSPSTVEFTIVPDRLFLPSSIGRWVRARGYAVLCVYVLGLRTPRAGSAFRMHVRTLGRLSNAFSARALFLYFSRSCPVDVDTRSLPNLAWSREHARTFTWNACLARHGSIIRRVTDFRSSEPIFLCVFLVRRVPGGRGLLFRVSQTAPRSLTLRRSDWTCGTFDARV